MDVHETMLVRRAIDGDMEALSVLLAEHGPRIARQISLQIQSAYRGVLDAEDVMQVTYLEAFLRVRSFVHQGPEAFAIWLKQIATNNLRDAIRELERQKRPPADRRIVATATESGPAALLDRVGWTSTTPSRCVNDKEMRKHLLVALDRLPRDYACVLRLYDLEGHKPADVALKMKRSIGAVHMLRARAIDQLRAAFTDVAGVSGNSA
jgi:RNA polymerase sigma factor (sigma-70 family)